jgi:hypothetical protein
VVSSARVSDSRLNYRPDLLPCGYEIIGQLRRAAEPSSPISEARHTLQRLEITSEDRIKSESISQKIVPLHSRRLYTDCRLLHSLLDMRDSALTYASGELWERAVRRLDMAIIVAGAPGDGRLDLILDTIEIIQAEHISMQNPSKDQAVKKGFPPVATESPAPRPIPRFSTPSLSAFRSTASFSPFILPGFIKDWPALTDHPWSSPSYLKRVAGRGRIVPVEVGSDYRAEEWGQRMMSWEEFLRGIGMDLDSEWPFDANQGSNSDAEDSHAGREVLYLAQHSLLTQFPALRSDIVVPDYVYASLPPPITFPAYRPPGNDEQLVINAWLGPKGTVSPAHTVLPCHDPSCISPY